MKARAFSLVELIIVVCILGIFAAMVIPRLQGNTIRTKEAAAKDTLRTLRVQIELYKFEHNGLAPGYQNGIQALLLVLERQFIGTSMLTGQASANPIPTGSYIYGPYIKKLPTNPFNNLSTLKFVPEGTAFSDVADGTSSGWLYKKETAEIKLNWTGADSRGMNYHDY